MYRRYEVFAALKIHIVFFWVPKFWTKTLPLSLVYEPSTLNMETVSCSETLIPNYLTTGTITRRPQYEYELYAEFQLLSNVE
jgi:hypothetical protein